MKHVAPKQRRKSVVWTILGILAELMLTAAAVCALYIAWQMWWTGVQAEHNQIETRQSVSWSDPGQSDSVAIAQAQEGDPPTQPQSAQEGELIAQVYIPRFGSQWQRNLVEGTSLTELNKHGLGHYKDSQMPGQVGNFAFAGHRNGYGQPLGDVDKLQEGDPIIVRTQDYWYVYHYTSYKIVLPTDIEVVAANPENPGATPTKRMRTEILHADTPLDQLRGILILGEGVRRHPPGARLHRLQRQSQIRQQRKIVDRRIRQLTQTVDSRRARRICDHLPFRAGGMALAVSRRRARRTPRKAGIQLVRRIDAIAAGCASDSTCAHGVADFRGGRIVL